MSRVQAFALLLALVPVAWALMWLGWRARGRSQSGLPRPHAVQTQPGGRAYEGVYVSTTTHGDWLDRVVVHGLGVRSDVAAYVGADGVALVRRGAPSVFVPRGDLVGAGRTSGMAGKFVEADGLAVITWVLGRTTVDTGIRLRRATDTADLVAAVSALASGEPGPDPRGGRS
ncbi:MAG: hypothetical protein ACKVZ6_07155 [Kineosporiaceae bacterium]